MKKILLIITITLATSYSFADLVEKKISLSAKVAMDKLERILKKKKFTIFARIDHGKNATLAGLKLDANEVIIFGNPLVGTKLMNENPQMGLELPLKIVIYEVSSTESKLAYINPSRYEVAYGIRNKTIINKITSALDKITDSIK